MKVKYHIVGLFILLLLFSCSTDDKMPEVKTQSIRIKAVALIAPDFPTTEGDVIEVYGAIAARVIVEGDRIEERILWQRDSESYERVGSIETSIASQDTEHVFTITNEEIENTTVRIEFDAKMWDKDPEGNPDDYLGWVIEPVLLEEINTVSINEEGTLFPVQLRLNFFDGITLLVRCTIEYV